MPAAPAPDVAAFFDEATNTVSYVVADPGSGAAAVVDPVLDYDPETDRTSTEGARAIAEHVRARGLTVEWLLETHVHADHLSAAGWLRGELGGAVGIGERVVEVREAFAGMFPAGRGVPRGGPPQFDRLFADGDRFAIGGLAAAVLHTPGHTPACVAYLVGDAVFVGDTIFMPDFGTARCDFPGGSAETLYDSIGKILALPGGTRLFVGHDYKAPGRDRFAWETTVAEQRAHNAHVGAGASKAAFARMRAERDATLAKPRLFDAAIRANIGAGAPQPAEAGG